MRHQFKNIAFILILAISHAVWAQESTNVNTQELLIGTWALDYNETISHIKPDSKTYYNNLDSSKKNHIKNSFSKRKITFKANGTYILEINQEKSTHGTWQLLSDQTSLNVTLSNDRQLSQRIESINASELCLNLGGDPSANRLFGKWYLKKSNN